MLKFPLILDIGIINRFNGVDIKHTQDFIKIYNKTYIDKIISTKGWLHTSIPGDKHSKYIPMHNDQTYNTTIEQIPHIPTEELPAIEKSMAFTYKQGIGKLIYTLVPYNIVYSQSCT